MIRLFPRVANKTTVAHGRSQSASPGSFVDVADNDAAVLLANGWVRAGIGMTTVGSTAQRPSQALSGGETHIDTTASIVVVWTGENWRNVVTGAVA